MHQSKDYKITDKTGVWTCYDYDYGYAGDPTVRTFCVGPNKEQLNRIIPGKVFYNGKSTLETHPVTETPVVETVFVDPAAVCNETTEPSGAITKKCCIGSVCNSKIIAKDTVACDCDENFKYAINDAISRGKTTDTKQELADLRARQGACFSRCRTPEVAVTKKTKVVATVTPSKPTIRDRRRVVYSSNNQ